MIVFSLKKKFLPKHLRVPKSTKEDLLQVLASNHLGLPGTKHHPPWLERINQIVKTKRLTDYPTHMSCSQVTWIF
jgi:hypothetical protein